ncbi:MAG: hypothetical protein PQJ59_10885 [Spirochaetales bacterium]|nr:hypothetical protein [Spirochaetales bacterium]
MSRIKSALELAMEKTADVEADRGAIYRAEAAREAKKRVSLFLEGKENDLFPEEVKEKDTYGETLKETLLINLKLPRINEDLAKVSRLEEGFSSLIKGSMEKEAVTGLFGQLKNFFAQYLDSRDHLLENLAAQYEPQLRQKEAQIRQQTGQAIRLTPEEDPEFVKILQEQRKMMDSQYEEVIKQAKDQLKELL